MIRKIDRNRRGDLRDNALELIIAVIGILLVIYAVYLIYNVFVNSENENAKKVLNNVEAKINAIPLNQTGTFLVQGFKEADQWFLAGWSKGTGLDNQPAKCFDSSCICICKREGDLTCTASNKIKQCQEEGFCRKFSVEKLIVEGIRSEVITSRPGFDDAIGSNIIGEKLVSDNCAQLSKTVIEVSVKKERDLITLSQMKR